MSNQKRKEITFTEEIILKNKKSINPFIPIPGVYFLINKNKIVYIGRSHNILSRLFIHLKNPNKIFTHYHIIKNNFKTENSLWLESEYIMKFKPKYNSTLPGPRPFKTLQEINKASNTNNLWTIKKCVKKNNIKTHQFNNKLYLHIADIPNFYNLLNNGGAIWAIKLKKNQKLESHQ